MERASKEKYHDFVWQDKSKDIKSLNDSHLSVLDLLPEGSVLDVGCGIGNLSYHIQQEGRKVVGADIAGTALSEAKKKGIETVLCDLDGSLPFKDGSFDCVVSCQVFQHIFQPLKLLNDMKRVSRKFIIINVPNIAYWKYRLRLLRGDFPFTSIDHHEPIRFFTLDMLDRLITDASLISEKVVLTGSSMTGIGPLFATGFTVLARKGTDL